ncbi:M48 family metallopeptidase [Streptomyces caatingaensis]|uniref:Peptidase M48 domain-containing protein n=1 Tax=Streptomyces caatingaensis TaxID=1678637 RepID=A0A0K9XMB8_9ACTN|nr:M48 family metallopeptidase [Streptomyces caatingaensis]KNB53847.1 hypothetical protein AC230_04455 [Streptomyces caatingaensis]
MKADDEGTARRSGAPARTRFPGISSRAYEHPADRAALVALRKLRGLDTFVRKFRGAFLERALRMEALGEAVRTSDRQFRTVHRTMREASRVLDLDRTPELFVRLDRDVNAATVGVDRPFVVLSSGMLELMDAEELRFVIGHELGHAMSGHLVYGTIARFLAEAGRVLASVPMGGLGLQAVRLALGEWMRMSELSCDRAGLLVVQDREPCLRALMKLAGGAHLGEMDAGEFLRQAAEYRRGEDLRDSVVKFLIEQPRSHPLAVARVAELDHWASGDGYRSVLAGDYALRRDDAGASVRGELRTTGASCAERVRRSTDPLLVMLRDLAVSADRAGDHVLNAVRRGPGAT